MTGWVLFITTCSPTFMYDLPYYSHMENTCMTTSFYYDGRFGLIKIV